MIKKVDYEKILSIESGGANRDGLAFAYHLKELESRKEEHKVFFIWSDGEPADTGYMGSEAVKDIQNIIAAHPKVDTVAFGIGQSAPQLQRFTIISFTIVKTLMICLNISLKSLRRFSTSSNEKIKA